MAAKYRDQLNAPPEEMEIAVEASAEEDEEYEVPDAMEEAEIPEEVVAEESVDETEEEVISDTSEEIVAEAEEVTV